MNKRVAIVFADVWLAFSPTTLGIYDSLKEHGVIVAILTVTQDATFARDLKRNVVIVDQEPMRLGRLRNLAYRIKRRAARLAGMKTAWLESSFHDYSQFLMFNKALRRFAPDEIIAVDLRALAIVQHSLPQVPVNLLSLEIPEFSERKEPVVKQRISRVIIQSQARLEHLFNGAKPKAFFVQNAPTFRTFALETSNRKGLVFCGTALEGFGILSCLKFLSLNPEYHLTVKGAVPPQTQQYLKVIFPELLSEERLKIDTNYLEMDALVEFLKAFRIGFCFYDTRFEFYDRFNYHTVPSGKMFTYLASGVPVICNNLPGLRVVEEFGAGVLIEDLDAGSILSAIQKIEANYDYYAQNCLKAAAHFSFEESLQPFIDELLVS
jgi:glycosyltransferase involved in cell wall biosynthesis